MIEARSVRVGDKIFDIHAYHPSARWVRVVKVSTLGGSIKIETTNWYTLKHPLEGVTVNRE